MYSNFIFILPSQTDHFTNIVTDCINCSADDSYLQSKGLFFCIYFYISILYVSHLATVNFAAALLF